MFLLNALGNQNYTRLKITLKKSLASTLMVTLMAWPLMTYAQPTANTTGVPDSVQIRGGISVGAKGDTAIPAISLRDAEIKDVLYGLAEQGGFNMIVDDSVTGTLSLDLKNITINKTLEYILTLADLTYYKDGNTFIITTRDKGDQKSLNKLVLKSIPVHYSNASDLSNVLNSTVFSIARPGGNTNAIATADPRTNSILIMGNAQDIDLASRALAELDFPLQHKTFFLKNAPPVEVANAISQTLFSVSLSSANGSSGGTSSSSGTSGSTSGTGSTTSGTSTGTSSSGTTGTSSSGTTGTSTSGTGTTGTGGSGIQVLQGGPVTFIANTANNTLTLIGTAQQIQLAEAMLYDVDIKPPQVAIQVSVIELDESKTKGFQPIINSTPGAAGQGSIQGREGGLSFSGDNSVVYWNKGGDPTLGTVSMLQSLGVSASFQETKGKILANPTVLAVSGTTSSINVSNDVFAGSQVVFNPTTGGPQTSTPIIKQVGIKLDITPQVSNNGTVTLKLSPTVSSPIGPVNDRQGNLVTTLTTSNTLSIAQARVKDGETLILGGLIRENNTSGWQKIPFLGDLPILGAMLRASSTNATTRSELVILVTPHIIKEEGVPYFRKEWQNSISYNHQGAVVVPVNQPAELQKNLMPAVNSKSSSSPLKMEPVMDRRSIHPKASPPPVALPTFSEVLK